MRNFDFVEFPVVNAGSLSLGEYGYMQLVHDTLKNDEGEEQ